MHLRVDLEGDTDILAIAKAERQRAEDELRDTGLAVANDLTRYARRQIAADPAWAADLLRGAQSILAAMARRG